MSKRIRSDVWCALCDKAIYIYANLTKLRFLVIFYVNIFI